MDKTKLLTILRICAQVVASAVCGFITIWCANKATGLILKGTSLIFENDHLKEQYGTCIAIILTMIVGLCEVKLAVFPFFAKIFKINITTVNMKDMLLSVVELISAILIGLLTTFCVHYLSAGIYATTDLVLSLINQKWKAFFGIIILALLGIGELKLLISFLKKRNNTGKGRKKGKAKA